LRVELDEGKEGKRKAFKKGIYYAQATLDQSRAVDWEERASSEKPLTRGGRGNFTALRPGGGEAERARGKDSHRKGKKYPNENLNHTCENGNKSPLTRTEGGLERKRQNEKMSRGKNANSR